MPPIRDPFRQLVRLTLPNGHAVPVPLNMIEQYRQYCVQTSINFGTQIGASAIVLVVMLMMLRPEKLRSPVIALNLVALALNLVRTVLQCLFFTGSWAHVYAVLAGDYSRVRDVDANISMAVPVLIVLLLIAIEASLVLQVRAVFVTAAPMHRHIVLLLSIAMAGVAVGFKLAWAVVTIRAVGDAKDTFGLAWLASSANIATTTSISVFSAVFVGKLIVALRRRRQMGIRQFGPMQVIIIMGLQTMIVPAIFSGVQYLPDSIELYTQVLTVTALFLPLSAIWATAAVDGSTSNANYAYQKRLLDHGSGAATGSSRKTASSYGSQADSGHGTLSEKDGQHIVIDRSFKVEGSAV